MAGEDVTFCQYKLNVMQNAVVQCQIISSGIIHLQTLNWICFATMYIWCEDFNTNIDDMYVVCRNMKCQHNLLGCLSNPPFFGSKHSNVNKVIFVFMMDKSRCLLPVSVFSVSSQWVIQGRGSQFKKSWSPLSHLVRDIDWQVCHVPGGWAVSCRALPANQEWGWLLLCFSVHIIKATVEPEAATPGSRPGLTPSVRIRKWGNKCICNSHVCLSPCVARSHMSVALRR